MKIVVVLIGMMIGFVPAQGKALEEIEIYLAGYGMVTQPTKQGLSLKGRRISDERHQGDPGGGVKIGLFPSVFHGYLGMELESFGHHNSLSFSIEQNDKRTKGKSSLITYTSMINFIVRYPDHYVRPYVGIGGGVSNGILFDTDIPGRNDKNVEMRTAPGYQLFGGIQLVVAESWFVFGEYKYNSANFHWRELSLNFRSEYILGGVGYIF